VPGVPRQTGHGPSTPDDTSGGGDAAIETVPLPWWTAPTFLFFSVLLVPWIVWLAVSLPSSHVDRFYDVTWVGFDVGLLAALAAVVWLAHRRSSYVELAATAAATMLVVDAWFDTTTSTPGADRWEAIAACVFVELPIAALCVWLIRNAERVRSRRSVSQRRQPMSRA